MGIVKLQPDISPSIERTLPDTIQEPSKSIFTTLIPETKIQSLLKYVEGYPWTVNFYGQILNTNNTIEHFDPTTPNLTQPYYKVSKLILQVDSPLTSSYDQATGVTTISGTSITPYKIHPNVGDVFIAQVDNGEDAIFHITSVTRKTHRKDTLYEISYSLYSYTSVNPDFLSTLESRVNETYFFNSDTNFFNRDVLIKPSVKEAIDRLKLFLEESKKYYFSTFIQKRTGSLIIPGIDKTLYDPLLISFILKTVDYDYLVYNNFNLHIHNNTYINQPSIFDALLQRSISTLNVSNKTYRFLPTHLIPNRVRLGTVIHSGIDYILYPVEPNINIEVNSPDPIASSLFLSTPKTERNYSSISSLVIETTNNNQIYTKPLLHELFNSDYYLVTENFYNYLNNSSNYEEISYIELLLAKFIKNEAIAKEDLAVACESYHSNWSLLHKLYLLPTLWLLVNANI